MSLIDLFSAVLALQAATHAQQPGFGEAFMRMVPMFVLVFFIFYFMVLRPQQQRQNAQEQLVSGLKRGDGVVTLSGLIAKVSSVETDHVVLDVANGVKVKFERTAIARKVETAAEKAS